MSKLYIGCGPWPYHPQHLVVLKNIEEWTLVDKFVDEPGVEQWDGRTLDEVPYSSVEAIYSSHTLEHFEHRLIPQVLKTWYKKLRPGGELTLNVPDLNWAARLLRKLDSGLPINRYYNQYAGEHGVLSIFYGSQSHDGEYHKSGYTRVYLQKLLEQAGFMNIEIQELEDAHDMGVLIATCKKGGD